MDFYSRNMIIFYVMIGILFALWIVYALLLKSEGLSYSSLEYTSKAKDRAQEMLRKKLGYPANPGSESFTPYYQSEKFSNDFIPPMIARFSQTAPTKTSPFIGFLKQ